MGAAVSHTEVQAELPQAGASADPAPIASAESSATSDGAASAPTEVPAASPPSDAAGTSDSAPSGAAPNVEPPPLVPEGDPSIPSSEPKARPKYNGGKAAAAAAKAAKAAAKASAPTEAPPPASSDPARCAACLAFGGTRPCSVECFVKAGYRAEDYETFLANRGVESDSPPSLAPPVAPFVIPRKHGHSYKHLKGTAVNYPLRHFEDGYIGLFPNDAGDHIDAYLRPLSDAEVIAHHHAGTLKTP